jgi:P-type Mg2+ transporter
VTVQSAEVARAAAAAAIAAAETSATTCARLGVDPAVGLSDAEAAARRATAGPNSLARHQARALPVLWRQVKSPLLALLVIAAIVSALLGERTDAVIIGVIVALSVTLGFVNEFRAERQAEALHAKLRATAVVLRGGASRRIDVIELVPGDVVDIDLGDVVPADLRLLETSGLAIDESVLTGESLTVEKGTDAVPAGTALAELAGAALMGTIVAAGSGRGVVVATARSTEFGAIAAGLDEQQLETAFQIGLRRFSGLLAIVAGVLSVVIVVVSVALQRPVIDALLFALAIAIGITPQLLPAVVSTSLAAGATRLSRAKVLVKRLVCIEDLGDVATVFTDKTGTLTEGRLSLSTIVPVVGVAAGAVLEASLLATDEQAVEGAGGNPLDRALWDAPEAEAARSRLAAVRTLGTIPFDHRRRMASAVVAGWGPGVGALVTKGAPESVLARCSQVAAASHGDLDRLLAEGLRVVAVAQRPFAADRPATAADETELELLGFVTFLDTPKADARAAIDRLTGLGVEVKIVTGDHPVVAAKVCRELGLPDASAVTGAELATMTDAELAERIPATTVFARVSPEDKARIVRVRRLAGAGVAFLGDGVNDALALHAADVGISVESGTDVAKDAADVILLEQSLGVLADGVAEGRRIFANTMKYVLMGTSSNFGNMFSAAGASMLLPFLPMLPSQILLNNLLYDAGQLAIPTDRVDGEQLRRPSHWDIGYIRRFMLFFGPLSSVFDFATFGLMLWVLHAGPEEFRTGWFVESLATQALVIFAIRTRRVPFLRSRPSAPMALATLAVVAMGVLLPLSPLQSLLGFAPLPPVFFAALAGMVVAYLVLIELGKLVFSRLDARRIPVPGRSREHRRGVRVRRRAARFSAAGTRARPRAPRRHRRP